METKNRIYEEAMRLLAQGCSVIPIQVGEKRPAINWEEYQKRIPNPTEIDNWFGNGSDYQLGLVTGCVSNGMFILDFDGEDCFDVFAEFIKTFPEFRHTEMVETGSGKLHLHASCQDMPRDLTKKVRTFKGNGHVELRANGHQTLIPPSKHPDGGQYKYISNSKPIEITVARLNELLVWIENGKGDSSEDTKNPPGWRQELFEKGVSEGLRNGSLTKLAGFYLSKRLEREEILTLMVEANKRFIPPLEQKEVETILDSVIRTDHKNHPERYEEKPISSFTTSTSADEVLLKYHLTDVGNAESFYELHGNDFIFIKEKKTWIKFDGVRWVEAEAEAKRKMIDTMRSKSKLAMSVFPPDSDQMKQIVKWCLASESSYRLAGAMNLATIYVFRSINDFDKDPWLLCCKNGAVDLKTGKLRPATPEDMLQRSTNITHDAETKCSRWVQFLDEVFTGNEELIDFIQRAIGYTLTGLTREQCLFILFGTGANGKSVFLGVLGDLLGEYGLTTSFSTFKEQNYDSIPNDVARMTAARMVKSAEIKEGARLNEERIKALTGGDRVTARFLHNEWFDFDPIAKFWVAVNHKPVIRGTDEAIWRRIRLIPFEETFPPERRDKDLLEKLRMELPGILNWAIEGCLKYQKKGLEPVEKVKRATELYRSESDVINQFLQEKSIEKTGARAKGSDLYNAYKTWCIENGEQALNSTQFGRRLVEKGYEKEKRGSYVYYLGIGIVQVIFQQDS
jgi:putative DNA primase/helicase